MSRRDAKWWVPWRVIEWLGRRDIWCWADLVMWKTFGSDRVVRRNTACAFACARDNHELTCYCGFWDRVARERAKADENSGAPRDPQ